MDFTEQEFNKVKKTLLKYREKVYSNEEKLDPVEDSVELENKDKDKIWIHPRKDGKNVDIHIMCACVKEDVEHNDEKDISNIRSKVGGYLTALGFRSDAVYTPFSGNKRINYRADFSQMFDEDRNHLKRQV